MVYNGLEISGNQQSYYTDYRVADSRKSDYIEKNLTQEEDSQSVQPFREQEQVVESRTKISKQVKLEDISLTFVAEETFDYIGQNSSIASLDVKKAVSDMQKDKVLQEYQYFVGSMPKKFAQMESEDGLVIAKF